MRPPVVYFDYNATTPCDPRVMEAMKLYMNEQFGNSASQMHAYGWQAQSAVDQARMQVAQLIGSKSKEVYFTSGATESNNWALMGLLRTLQKENPGQKIHFISSSVEHSSVLKALKGLNEYHGLEYDLLPVDQEGRISIQDLKNKIRPETKLVSLIFINNEIGTIQDLKAISQICREKQIYLHTDATQAVGKIPVDVNSLGVDLLSASAHKFYGPKGVGFLYARSQSPHVEIAPLFFGGGHENNWRSGTLNVPGIVGLGVAARIAQEEMMQDQERIESLRNRLFAELREKMPTLKINGPGLNSQRAVNNLNITLPYSIESQLHQLTSVAFSPGSACQAENKSISHVLTAIGLSEEESRRTLRLSLGRWTTQEDVLAAAKTLLNPILKTN